MISLLVVHGLTEAQSRVRAAREKLAKIPTMKGPVSDQIRDIQNDIAQAERWLDGLGDHISAERLGL